MQVPLHHLASIVCFGWAGMSPELMAACVEAGISVAFLFAGGRFLARVEGPLSGNVLLRRAQYRVADNPAAVAALAKAFVAGKIANSRAVLQRALRDRPQRAGAAEISEAIDHIGRLGLREGEVSMKRRELRGGGVWLAAPTKTAPRYARSEASGSFQAVGRASTTRTPAFSGTYTGAVADLCGGRRGLKPCDSVCVDRAGCVADLLVRRTFPTDSAPVPHGTREAAVLERAASLL